MINNETRYTIRRYNFFYGLILGVALGISSYPRLLLEVFIRKNFGKRYFQIGLCLLCVLVLGAWPRVRAFFKFDEWLNADNYQHGANDNYWIPYLTWYIFLALFLVFSFIRYFEILRQPPGLNMNRKGTYSGDHLLFFTTFGRPETKNRLRAGKVTAEERKGLRFNSTKFVEVVLEPLPFFILGLILYFLGQKLGVLLITCSVIYSLGYHAAYLHMDEELQDVIDKNHTKAVRSSARNGLYKEAGFQTVGREAMENYHEDNQDEGPIKIS